MIFHSVKLINYKSIGEEKNEIIIEPNVTSIIGKNESGKSNIITGLANFRFFSTMQQVFTENNTNRNNHGSSEMKFVANLKFTSEEKIEFGTDSDTQFIRTKDSNIATGGVFEFFNTVIRPKVDELLSKATTNSFKLSGQELTTYQNYIKNLIPENGLNFTTLYEAFNYLNSGFPNIQSEEKEIILTIFNEVKSLWNKLFESLPKIFFYNSNKILKQQYTFEEVQKELNATAASSDSLLSSFVDILEVDKTDFINAVRNSNDPIQTNIRYKIKRKVEEKFNRSFNGFYNAEKINLDCDFYSGAVSFNIQSNDGEVMHLSERSNGLRWYLNFFIDTVSNNLPTKNVLYLFDEPATSLHVNAQKEVLKLFDDLAEKGNQIVYTTHSPFMLTTDNGGLHRIRAIDKSNDGYTHIYKTAYDQSITPQNQADTFAPIIKAIGMDLADNFGPAKNKLNIICEGVSDYIYFKTIVNLIDIDTSKFNIIPSTGVTNVPNMCNLLLGWKCPFVAVFDYDNEGVVKGGNVMKKSELYEENKDFIYLKSELTDSDFETKTYNTNPYMVEDLIGRNELVEFAVENKLGETALSDNKTQLAKLYCSALENSAVSLTQASKDAFENLFDRLQKTVNEENEDE